MPSREPWAILPTACLAAAIAGIFEAATDDTSTRNLGEVTVQSGSTTDVSEVIVGRATIELLTDDGVAVIHTIGRADGPGATNPWINKYIFPGGYSPALSEVSPMVENSNLYITDVEVLRLHYAETLRHWRKRFYANRDRVRELFDERFCRMWEFYLASTSAAFHYRDLLVYQLQIVKNFQAIPSNRRDYIYN